MHISEIKKKHFISTLILEFVTLCFVLIYIYSFTARHLLWTCVL